MALKTFAHSGDLGDVIYALPTIKALGGGELLLYPDPRVREKFTPERAHNLGVFLAEQPYIRRWRYAAGVKGMEVDYDFARWRDGYDGRSNLAYSHARAFGVSPAVADESWLTVEHPAALARVVVVRSHRYRQNDFPWLELARRYRDESVVIGTISEAEELFFLYGFTRHVETPTMSEVARVIAGAELVITNQTAAYAIAEGLKKTVILERYGGCPNVDFDRPNVYTGDRVIEFLSNDARPTPTAPSSPPPIRGVRAEPVAV